MDIFYPQHLGLMHWAAQQLNVAPWNPDQARWLSGWDGEQLRFVVIYSRFSSRNCELTIATDGTRRWASRASLRAIFRAPFIQWNLRRVTFVVKANNEPSLSLVTRLGATQEGCIRECFDDCDGLVLGMLKEECKWIA